MAVDWSTLRSLCAEAGIADEFEEFEGSLKPLMVGTLLAHFGKERQYLSDSRFRMQVNELVGVLAAAITRAAKSPTVADMDTLQEIFKTEVKDARE